MRFPEVSPVRPIADVALEAKLEVAEAFTVASIAFEESAETPRLRVPPTEIRGADGGGFPGAPPSTTVDEISGKSDSREVNAERPLMLPDDARRAIERSEAEADQAKRIAVELRHQLYATNLAHEKAGYVNAGVPTELVEIASPLLYGEDHIVRLSPAVSIDAGATVRKMLESVRDAAKAPAKRISVVDIEGACDLLERWEREQNLRNDV
jgi:hypothetical protein